MKKLITDRESQILYKVANGLTAREIAHALYISIETVHSHRTAIKCKLNARNTAHMIRRSYEEGILQLTLNAKRNQGIRRVIISN